MRKVRDVWTLAMALAGAAPTPAVAKSYLYVWAMETHDPSTAMPPASSMGHAFLAVFDVTRGAAHFGKLVAMLPVGGRAQMAHHTNYDLPSDGRLFASDYMSGDNYVFDVRDPAKPKLSTTFGSAGPYTHAHSFERLTNGHTLIAYQFKGDPDRQAGALVEVDAEGRVVRASDASDPAVDSFIRPYSVLALPKIDRVVTTSADMLPHDQKSHVIQVWRLSDLKLVKTVRLPEAPHYADAVSRSASEARLLDDGNTVLAVTGGCGLYRLEGLAGTNPAATFVYDFGDRMCGVPVVVGHYWIQTTMSGHSLTSLDVSDPSSPKEAGRLVLKSDYLPHWVSREPGGTRIAITGFGLLATHLLFATVNSRTGALKLEPQQIDFDRRWPDGWVGPAMPHAAVFGRAQ